MKKSTDSDLLPDTATLVEVIAKINLITSNVFPPPTGEESEIS